MKKKRIIKPKFDEGDNVGIYRGTVAQHANPNQLWEREKPLDEVIVTPKGSYPNMQAYIAATHGSAYDSHAPFEMFNDLTFNAAPMLFDAAYQGVTGTYGKADAKTPALKGMGLLYKYTAPSRWLGSAKSLLPGYEFAAPWSDNNPGLTGDSDLDGIFDILVGKGVGDNVSFRSLKNKVRNNTLAIPTYIRSITSNKKPILNERVYDTANKYYSDRYNIKNDYDLFTLDDLFDINRNYKYIVDGDKKLGHTMLTDESYFGFNPQGPETLYRPISTKIYYDNGVPTKYPKSFSIGLRNVIEKNIKRKLDRMTILNPDDRLMALENSMSLSKYEKGYLDYLQSIRADTRFNKLVGVNASTYLMDPNKFKIVYDYMKDFKGYLSEHPSLAKRVFLNDGIKYDPEMNSYIVGNLTSGKPLLDFINNIKLAMDDDKDIKFDTNTLSAELGYSDESPIFKDSNVGIVGSYNRKTNKRIVLPQSEDDLNSTMIHEAYSHATDDAIRRDAHYLYEFGPFMDGHSVDRSGSWYEGRATLNELAFNLWNRLERPDLPTFRKEIDKISDEKLIEEFRATNAYGSDIIQNAKESYLDNIAFNIRLALKRLPFLASPILLKKPNNQDKQ